MTKARDADSTRIKSLTKKTRQGETYIRRADAELQIEKILTLEKQQILEMLGSNKWRDEADYLLDETLVYLSREARINGDDEIFNEIYEELNRRIWKLLLKFRRNFGANQTDFEDFGQKTEMAILRKLLNTDSDAADFAQVQFGSFVISEAKGVNKQNLIAVSRDQKLFETAREDDETGDEKLENISLTNELSAESKMIFSEGIKKLSPDQQMVAAMLLDGFQIESKDENEMTISRHLGVSSRTIRNWVKEMRALLTEYKEETNR